MTDLETRVRDTLTDHAGTAGEWRVPGELLRGAAADRASSRRRTAAVVAGALVAGVAGVAVVTGTTLGTGDGRDSAPLPGATDRPTSSATTTATGPRRELLQVPVPEEIVQQIRLDLALGTSELVATAALPRSGDTLLVFAHRLEGDDPRTVVDTITLDRGRPLVGTVAWYHPDDELVVQPARDGDGATMVVIAPAGSEADSVEVTTSLPGKDIKTRMASLDGGLAMVPVPSPHNVTRLRLVHAGAPEQDRIPGSFYLPDSVPPSLARVAAAEGDQQQTQVRTDGRSACRLTVNGMDGPASSSLAWDLIDDACAPIDGDLHLLIAEDRRYSSVAGVVPVGTTTVRLTWRSGSDTDVTETPVRNPSDDVPVFIDESGHRPDQLTRAEALDADGNVLATTLP